MTPKEKILQVKSYEEFNQKREEFRREFGNEFGELQRDREVMEHLGKIFPKVSNTKEELYKTLEGVKNRDIGR